MEVKDGAYEPTREEDILGVEDCEVGIGQIECFGAWKGDAYTSA